MSLFSKASHFSAFMPSTKIKTSSLLLCSLMLNVLGLAVPFLLLQVYDRILVNKSEGTLYVLVLGVSAAIFLEMILRISRSYMTGWTGAVYEHETMTRAIEHSLHVDLGHLERKNVGDHLYSMSAISKLRDFYSGQALTILIDLPFIAVYIVIIGLLAGYLMLVPLVLILVFGVIAVGVGKRLRKKLQAREDTDHHRFNFIFETLHGIHTVKALGLESTFLRRYEHLHAKTSEANYHATEVSSRSNNYSNIFAQLMMVCVVAFGCPLVLSGQVSMGTVAACVLLSGRAVQPVQRALGIWMRFQDFSLAQTQISEHFHMPVVPKQPDARPPSQGFLALRGLHYDYGDPPHHLLNNISLMIKPGDAIELSSERPGGKTTLFNLMTGIYEPTKGQILFDGSDIHAYPHDVLTHEIGYLPTSPQIFQGTIRDNLTGFRYKRMRELAVITQQLGLEDRIIKLPKGYDTQLIDSIADPIPPGVKQLITIARVLLNRPKVILYDSADRFLDDRGHHLVWQTLKKLNEEQQVTLVLVSYDEKIRKLATLHYHILSDGRLKQLDHPNERRQAADATQRHEAPVAKKIAIASRDAAISPQEAKKVPKAKIKKTVKKDVPQHAAPSVIQQPVPSREKKPTHSRTSHRLRQPKQQNNSADVGGVKSFIDRHNHPAPTHHNESEKIDAI